MFLPFALSPSRVVGRAEELKFCWQRKFGVSGRLWEFLQTITKCCCECHQSTNECFALWQPTDSFELHDGSTVGAQISGIGPDHTSMVDISPRRSAEEWHFLTCQIEGCGCKVVKFLMKANRVLSIMGNIWNAVHFPFFTSEGWIWANRVCFVVWGGAVPVSVYRCVQGFRFMRKMFLWNRAEWINREHKTHF